MSTWVVITMSNWGGFMDYKTMSNWGEYMDCNTMSDWGEFTTTMSD